ncbi:hypothetical protein B0A48_13207 [Cryoendolithus antarcticus]|uniref:Pyridoxamine 5'-phosphate oxidase N-terminal domain-containing protein n=1 Tax=Cryoendolithus antarcticus TaxID=1507870 RepID=A0A1V8SNH3_9PEZI|nr:hypothetical protein B0A48_13207 [Cryoendolithus antarcticus]
MASSHPPLTWQHSAEPTNPTIASTLPDEVVTCLQNARFLHLATCTSNTPHVSLMNYTYLPSHPFASSTQLPPPSSPSILMTSNPSSKKTSNLLSNPQVSLLVHDWVSTRPPNLSSGNERDRSPEGRPGGGQGRSSLASMLMQMNSTAVSSISATINGTAIVLDPGSEEEKWCREQHLANNTFQESEQDAGGFGASLERVESGDGGRASYVSGEDVKVVVVRIRDGRISDWKGGLSDFRLREGGVEERMVNGVVGTD